MRRACSTSLQNNKFINAIKPGDAHVARLYKKNKFINAIKIMRRPYRSSLQKNKFINTIKS